MNEINYELIAKFFEGDVTEDEKREIILWCNASSENKRVFSELKEIWQISGKIHSDFIPNTSAAWEKVTEKIDEYENEDYKKGRNFTWYFARVAAVFVIGFVLYFLFELNNSSHLAFERISSTDLKKEIYLPDSSKVWINKNTDLEYRKEFEGEERLVRLNGEAYFEVNKNPLKPFIIESKFSRIEVLGTSFIYRAYSSQNENFVIVNSGKVEFSDRNQEQPLILVKGEKGELNIDENVMKKSLNDDQNYLAWQTGILIFENETFENIIADLSNYYSQMFVFENSTMKSNRLTVTFDNEELENILNILERTIGVTFQRSSEKIIIK
jgi:ferric-dicitrate binding protein FerR (iron transport regulator)